MPKKREADMTLVVGKMDVVIEFMTPMLGTAPKNPEVYKEYIATKAPKEVDVEDEIGTVPAPTNEELEARGWSGFHVFNGEGPRKGELLIYDYMIKGFIKSAMEVLQANGVVPKIPAYKKWVDLLVFVDPRHIMTGLREPDGCLERPLRVMTPKGPRVAVTRSDFIKEGRQLSFQVKLLKNNKNITWDLLHACLAYGEYVGLGMWRGSGSHGRFKVVSCTLPGPGRLA